MLNRLFYGMMFILIFVTISFSQEQWYIVRQNDCEGDLESVYFLTEGFTGWAVGKSPNNHEVILKTTDGGATWIFQNSNITNPLNDVHFLNANVGWAVGKNGAVIHTTDGGSTWTKQTSGTGITLYSVSFIDINNGWAVGDSGKVIHTNDGGTTWTERTSGTNITLYSVSFTDANNGWAVGNNGTVIHTSNGGNTWISQGSWQGYLFGVYFIDSNNGWAVGGNWDIVNKKKYGVVLKTINGGSTWNYQVINSTNWLRSVYFTDVNHGSVVGEDGKIIKTTDSGTSWMSQISMTGNRLESVYFVDSNRGWAVGENGTLIHTGDGGLNWTAQTTTSNSISDIHFIDAFNGWAVGENGIILKTTDGGIDWKLQNSGSHEDLKSVYFTNANNGWAVGAGVNLVNAKFYGVVLKTFDGGSNWNYNALDTTSYLTDVYFNDTNNGWAVGGYSAWTSPGLIIHTTDAGDNWSFQNSGVEKNLNCVYFTDANNGWAVGGYWNTSGIIIHTINGGNTWTSQVSEARTLYSINFIDQNNGWACGYDGDVIHTNNGGATWISQVSGVNNTLSSIFFTDVDTGWAVGANGTVMHTWDGGNTWISQTCGTNYYINDLHLVSTNTGWAVGENGIILKYSGYGTEIVTTPDEPTGPSNGFTLQNISFGTGGSTSNYGHNVEFQFDWDDGYLSVWGSSIQSHSYNNPGIFQVKARARCQIHTAIISDWSEAKSILITNPPIKLYLSNSDKKLTENPMGEFPGYTQDIDSNNPSAVWNGYFLNGDIKGNIYSFYAWAISPYVSNLGQTTTHFKAEIIVGNSEVAIFNFSSSSYQISTGKKYTVTGIDPIASAGDEVKLKVSYTGGYGGTIVWGMGSGFESYIIIPEAAVTSIENSDDQFLPSEFILMQNYPNPFNLTTTITYQLPKNTEVSVRIYNLTGQIIKTLINEKQQGGNYSVNWNGKNELGQTVASGVYLYSLETKELVHTCKLILIR